MEFFADRLPASFMTVSWQGHQSGFVNFVLQGNTCVFEPRGRMHDMSCIIVLHGHCPGPWATSDFLGFTRALEQSGRCWEATACSLAGLIPICQGQQPRIMQTKTGYYIA